MRKTVSAGLTAMALFGGGMAAALAQDLDADKTPQQLFNLNCVACHQSPRGLAKTAGPGLASFLREHYTSGPPTAAALARYLSSVGGAPADARITKPKEGAAPPTTARAPENRPPAAVPIDQSRTAPKIDAKAEAKAAAKRDEERAAKLRRRAELEAQKADRLRRAERQSGVPVGLSRSGRAPWRPAGQPAVVETDPPAVAVTIAPEPTPPALILRHRESAAAAPPPPAPARPAAVPAAPIVAAPSPRQPEPPAPAAVAPPATPSPAAAGVEPPTPAASQQSPAVTDKPAASAPAADDLPVYPPPIDLDPKAPSASDQKHATQPGFASPVP